MNFTTKLKYFFRVLVTPMCWVQSYPYSARWDAVILKLLQRGNITFNSRYEVLLGDTSVWIENHPYSSFLPYNIDYNDRFRPSRMTILYAMDAIKTIKPIKVSSEDEFLTNIENNLKEIK